jgi:predicted 3-demethylubiquinone-9 3-methyltransferase (glyoxalase superfamily)
MSIYYELEGQKYMAINGGPCFQLSEAVSLYVGCENQADILQLNLKLV